MKYYDENKLLYHEADASGVGLGAVLLQTQDGTTCQKDAVPDNTILQSIAFASKSLASTECRDSNIEREASGTLHRLENFHCYCFSMGVNVITDDKPLVATFMKDIATLLQWIQQILIRIHQFRIWILSKPGLEIFISDWLSHLNHKENKDEAIHGMDIRVDAVQTMTDVPECMSIWHI